MFTIIQHKKVVFEFAAPAGSKHLTPEAREIADQVSVVLRRHNRMEIGYYGLSLYRGDALLDYEELVA